MNKALSRFLYFAFAFFLLACGTKEDPIKREEALMNKRFDKRTVRLYRALKTALRSSAFDTKDPAFKNARMNLLSFAGRTFFMLEQSAAGKDSSSFSMLKMLGNIKDLYESTDVLLKTDEDSLPTVTANIIYLLDGLRTSPDKIEVPPYLLRSDEHVFFAGAWYLSRRVPRDFALYEISRAKDDELFDHNMKMVSKICRAMMYYEEDWNYLSERAATEYIDLQTREKNEFLQSPWPSIDSSMLNPTAEKAWHQWTGFGYVMRGTARLGMDDEDKKKAAIDDYEKFVEEAEAGGLDNELTWTVGAYVNISREHKDKAVAYLGKLETSGLLSPSEKAAATEIKQYLEKRENGKALNTITDKLAILRIASGYIAGHIAESKQVKSMEQSEAGRKLIGISKDAEALGSSIPTKADADSLIEKSKEKIKGLFK